MGTKNVFCSWNCSITSNTCYTNRITFGMNLYLLMIIRNQMICKHYVNEITYFLVSFRVSNYRTRNQLVLTFISSQLFWGAKEETFMIICLKQKDAKINSKRSIFCCKKFSYFLYSYLMQWITVLSYSYRYCIQAIKTWLKMKWYMHYYNTSRIKNCGIVSFEEI